MTKKRLAVCLLGALLVCSLTGCVFENSVEEMFTLPQAPMEYSGLMEELTQLTGEGYEYLAPATGASTQSVQMVDLNGDGTEEAVAFFRRSSDEKPLKIFVFQNVEGGYEMLCTIASSGSSIESVYYEDLTGDGKAELIVGWKISNDVQTLAAYSVGREYISLLNSPYVRFSLQDIDGDGLANLLILRSDNRQGSLCECYQWSNDALSVTSRASLSSTAAEINRGTVVSGQLEGQEEALFVSGVSEELMASTDILVYRSTIGLINITSDDRTGQTSLTYPYQQLPPQDINGDGVTELPSPVVDNVLHPNMVAWFSYQSSGRCHQVEETYHSQLQGWYFSMPRSWWGRASASSEELSENESQTVISVDGREAVAIYVLSGDHREELSGQEGRFLISRQTAINYAGKILNADVAKITPDELRHSMYLPGNAWG